MNFFALLADHLPMICFLLQEFPGLLVAAATVDRMGRKFSMSAMFFLCCTFLLPLVFNQPQGITAGLLFGARICITATFTVVYIYAPEVSHDKIVLVLIRYASSILITETSLITDHFCLCFYI